MNIKKEPTYKEPIEGIKVWLLLGYPSKYWNYTSKCIWTVPVQIPRVWERVYSTHTLECRECIPICWTVPPFPQAPPKWISLLPILEIFLLNIKDVEFDFRMGYIPVLFSFLWIIKVIFTNFLIFEFLIFCFSKLVILAYFDQK